MRRKRPRPMRVEVVLFAALREAVGGSRLVVELPSGATGRDLRQRLTEMHPALADLFRVSRFASGVDFLDERHALTEGAEIVLIPPVSGGAGPPAVRLTREPLDAGRLRDAALRPGSGALVLFEGTVRSPSDGKD